MEYRIKKDGPTFEIKIVDHILDNVYGHIGITKVERKLERLPLFKRLHNISQLGFTNLVFPCALHNRYVHSIGVMHIASEMVRHINENVDSDMMFSDVETQIIRLAGMLHDIGHYPMSHNIEQAYKMQCNFTAGREKITKVADCLTDFVGCPKYLYPENIDKTAHAKKPYRKRVNYSENDYAGSTGYHHEAIGRLVIVNNKSIRDTIKKALITYEENNVAYVRHEFVPIEDQNLDVFSEEKVEGYTKDLLELIGAIVIGNYEYGANSGHGAKGYAYMQKYSAMVQLIHSELDADNIDYLLRDSTFSGTSYGFMDISVLLSSLTMASFKHQDYNSSGSGKEVVDYLVGIKPKAIGCVDQFFQNKYLAYTQMIMSKYVSALEFMLLHWARNHLTQTKEYGVLGAGKCTEEGNGLLDIVRKNEKIDLYLKFTDAYVMNELFTHDKYLSADDNRLFGTEVSRLIKYSAFDLDRPDSGVDDSDISCAEFGEDKIALQMLENSAYIKFKETVDRIGSKTTAEIKGTAEEKELYSFRFEEYAITKQLPYNIFYEAAFLDDSETVSKVDMKYAFQNHFYRLSNGIPVITEKEYVLIINDQYCAEDSIPKLVVDLPNALLHNTYQQRTVYLRRYKIEAYE